MEVSGGGRNKRKKDDDSSSKEEAASDDVEAAAVRRQNKDVERFGKNLHECRFCDQKFDKPQALGGHMNRHRAERENEEHQKALNLLNKRADQGLYNGTRWSTNLQGAVGAGTLMLGAPTGPVDFQRNQPGLIAQKWHAFNQHLATQQTINSHQPQQAGAPSYYNPPNNARPHQGPLQPHPQAQQQHIFNPGQSSTPQMIGQIMQRRSGAANAAWMQRIEGSTTTFQSVTQVPGRSTVGEPVRRRTTAQATAPTQSQNYPFTTRAAESNAVWVENEYANNHGPSWNEYPSSRNFQASLREPRQGSGFREEHYAYGLDEVETGNVEENQVNDEMNVLGVLNYQECADEGVNEFGESQ